MLFRTKPKTPTLTRQQSLSSQIIRNPEAVERTTDAGKLELTLTIKPARWMRLLGQADVPVVRKFELDDLGRYFWNQCAASPTVEQLIRKFAKDHHLNLREAEVSVLAFFQTLMKRGLVGVVPPGEG